MTEVLSIIAVIGAWVAGIGVLFAVLAFTFATVNPRLIRIGVAWLSIADVGAIAMLAALIGLIPANQTAFWVFSAVGIVVLLAITGGVYGIMRQVGDQESRANALIEGTRRRIEF